MQKKTLGHLYALFTILVWGSCFVLTKVMLTAYTPTQIIPLRMGLAYLTLWALRPRTLKLPWKDELMFILIGITGGSVYFFLQNTAAAHTSAANVSILVSMSPILTVILAQLFSRKGEKLGKLVYIGALVAIVGVVLVVLNGTLSFHLSPLGDLLALAAALMWAVYSILVKKYTERYDNFLVTRRVFLWAFLTSLPLVLLTDGMPSLSPLFSQPKILVSWLFLGVFGNAVCFAIWNIAFKRLGVVVTNNYLYASPFVTVVVGWLLLGEKISWMSILGAVLITLGVIFANKDGSQSYRHSGDFPHRQGIHGCPRQRRSVGRRLSRSAGAAAGHCPGPQLCPDRRRRHRRHIFIYHRRRTYLPDAAERPLARGPALRHHPPPGLQGNRPRRGPGLFFLLPRHHGLCPHRHP